MRPIRITMQAFGSYGEKEVIDLTLPRQNLFLISGDTGSGKTTIFDAMVFALYGEASSTSNKKDGKELQSQFIARNVEPYVELEFTEGCDTYVVRRSPQHYRPAKKRGSAEQSVSETVSLLMPDGSVYPSKETDAKLIEIVGLTKAQFMQVAMIAQGEFMAALRASTNDKKETFRKFFNTGIYESITEELKRRCKDKEQEMAVIRTTSQHEVGRIRVPENYERREELLALQRSIMGAKNLNIAEMESLLLELKLLCDDLSAKSAAAKDIVAAASDARDQALAAETSGRELDTQYRQLEKAEKDLAACAAAEPEIKGKQKLMEDITSAYEIQSVWKLFDQASSLAAKTDQELKTEQAALPGKLTAHLQADDTAAAAKTALDAEIAAYSQVKERVDKSLGIFSKIEAAEKDIVRKRRASEQAEKTAAQAQKAQTDFEDKVTAWRAEESALKDTPAELEKWKAENVKASDIREEIRQFRRAEQDAESQRKKADAALRAYESSLTAWQEKNAAYAEMQTAFYNAQAGLLAREQLHPNEPCPVCGSLEHPHPCVLADEHRELTREALEACASEAERLRGDMEKKSGNSKSAQTSLQEQENAREEKRAALRAHLSASRENVPENMTSERADSILSAWQSELDAKARRLNADMDQLAALQRSLSGVEDQRQSLKNAADRSAAGVSEAKQALSAAEAGLETLNAQRDYASPEEANAALSQAEGRRLAAQRLYDAQKAQADRARSSLEKTQNAIDRCEKDLPQQLADQVQRQADYLAALSEKSMIEERWKAAAGAHQKAEAARLRDEIDAHNKRMTEAEATEKAAREGIGGRPKPDMEVLQADRAAKDAAYAEASAALDEVKNTSANNADVYGSLSPKMEERARIVAEHTRLDSLYQRLSGKVSGARMDIETFVQRYYLEHILHLANNRFSAMSAGQFEMRLCDMNEAGKGANHGLDLMVYSTVTGQTREIHTLSGGESFMAALALELGMADQIQMSSASIHLDVMFIDEGFGSLDEHSRNQAVSVLKQMAGGDRLIGIISHVSELKQEIDDQLLVTKDTHGSHTAWQLS